MSYTVYHNSSNERSRDSTILNRRYDIPFGYLDILFMIINIYKFKFVA